MFTSQSKSAQTPLWLWTRNLVAFLITAVLSTLAHAQGGPVSPALLPSFTKDSEIVPVPSVDPDFLVRPKSFLYDATGANVFANALNPETNPLALSGARGQLDLSLRDSTQSGHSGPQNSSRLSALVDDSDSPAATIDLGRWASRQTGYGMPTSNSDFDAGLGGEPNSIYRSSWGGGSASQFQPSGSNWGVQPMQVQRMGVDDAAADSNNVAGMSSGYSTASRSGTSGTSNGTQSSQFEAASGGRRRRGSPAGLGLAAMNSSRQSGNASLLNRSESAASATSAGAGRGHSTMTSATNSPQTFERLMIFSPRSYSGYVFGATPFASTPSFSDETFLKPNIFAITLPSVPPRNQRELGQRTLDEGNGLANSATHYDTASNLKSEATHLGGGRQRGSKLRNPSSGESILQSGSIVGANSQ